MNLLEADTKLRKLQQPCLTTKDVSAYLDVNIVYASAILRRLSAAERAVRLSRGRWLLTGSVDPFSIPEYLTDPYPSYISFQTALYHHGMISQLPVVVYAASLSRTKRYKTPIGDFSIHHLSSKFFFGFDLIGKTQIKMASAEKALIDFLYLFPTRSRLFRALPEIELSKRFNIKLANEIIEKIPSRGKRSMVHKLFRNLFK